MDKVKKFIEGRRSIREYKDKAVSDDLIKEVIDAARLAPSGNNAQPSEYLVIKNSETKNKLRENRIFAQDFVYKAPVIIVCCTNPDAFVKSHKFDDYNNTRAVRDISIASSYLVLRATELGLGTCYIGWLDKEKIKGVLGIPKKCLVPYVITLGYSAEKPQMRQKKRLDEIVHWEKY